MQDQTADPMGSFGRRIAIVLILAVSSCSPAVAGQQHPKPSSPSPVNAPTATTPPVIPLSTAWPHAQIVTRSSSAFGEDAVSADGSTAFIQALQPDPPHREIGPAIMDRVTGHVTLIRSLSGRTQAFSVVGDTGWVAWVEGSIQPSFVDWVIYSYDRQAGVIRTLASAPKTYPYTPSVAISMSRGVIVWSAVEASDGVFHVSAVNADGTDLRILASNAKGPQIVWPWTSNSFAAPWPEIVVGCSLVITLILVVWQRLRARGRTKR
jgi:hypothetical protein